MYIFTYDNYINYLKHKDKIEELRKKLEQKYKNENYNYCKSNENKENIEIKENIGIKENSKIKEDNQSKENKSNKKVKEKTNYNILNEKSEKYIISNIKSTDNNEQSIVYINNLTKNIYINNKHDKIFRKILDNKQEASNFINKALELENELTAKDIEKYNSSFVTGELKNEESDIIYKIKDRNIFFLIEHQTKIDHTMAFRILEYQIEIIKSAINVKEELLKKLNEGEEKKMLAVLDMLEKENKKLIRQGIKEGVRKTAKKMLQENIPLQVIIRVTGLTENEIMKLMG